jgi:peptidoglycan/xylan/chitin deacetylase (PgdA/CDA1 family)
MRPAPLARVLGVSRALGGPRVWDAVRGGRVRILMYHGVPKKQRFTGVENHYGYNVPLAELEAQLAYLAARCRVVSLGDFTARRGLESRRTNVVLTFDDGYENNYTNALPVLERLGLPALFAVTTAFVLEREPLWNDVVEYAVRHTRRERVTLALCGETRTFALAPQGAPGATGAAGAADGRLALYNWLLRLCVQIDQLRRAELLERALFELEVERSAVLSDPDYRPLSPEQIQRLAGGGLVEIASHSVHHYLLAKLPREQVRREVRESKAALEALTGRPVRAFCLPGGSADRGVLDEIFAAGYEVVLTSEAGTVSPEQRVLKRCGIFSQERADWFVDQVHGPVHEVVEAAQRARGLLGRLWTRSSA